MLSERLFYTGQRYITFPKAILLFSIQGNRDERERENSLGKQIRIEGRKGTPRNAPPKAKTKINS